MSFLESVQHGLEKASKEAARFTKIQHLHNISNDLGFKASQEGQTLIAKAMEMYQNGLLAQGELVTICQQIATYQQQYNEIQEEIQRLQANGEEQTPDTPPPPAPNYPPDQSEQAYTAGSAPTGYLTYPAQPASGYPAYPVPPAGAPPYPVPPQTGYTYAQQPYPAAATSSEPPTKPGAPVQETTFSPSSEPPTKPGAPVQEAASSPVEAPVKHRRASHVAAPASAEEAAVAPAPHAQGMLPPIFSPYVNNPAPAETPEAEADTAKHPKAHHARKAADEAPDETPEVVADAPVKEKKTHKASEAAN